MATSTSVTNFDPALKQIYRPQNVQNLTYKNKVLFGLLPKFEGFGGRNMPVVLEYGNPQGRSTTFSTAQSNATEVKLEDFLLTRVNDYSVATITGEVIEATRGDSMAFLQALKTKINGAMNSLANSIETKLFRGGTGSIGTVGSYTGSATTFTLTQIEESPCYEVNMELVSSAADGGSLDSGNATVTAINRTTGVLTSDSAWDAQITGFAANRYLYVQGDAQNGGSALTTTAGLSAWFPATAPAAGSSFFGVDRSPDSRLYGLYKDGTGGAPLEEVLIDSQSIAAREEGAPNIAVMHHAQYRRLIKELGAKKDYTQLTARSAKGMVAEVGYRGVVVEGDHGPVSCVAANKCQANIAWVLSVDGLLLATLGNATKFLMEDNLRILRQASADGYEVRLGYRGNFCSKSPIRNVHVALPTP